MYNVAWRGAIRSKPVYLEQRDVLSTESRYVTVVGTRAIKLDQNPLFAEIDLAGFLLPVQRQNGFGG